MYEYVVLDDTVHIYYSRKINGKILIKVFDDVNGVWREMNILVPDITVVSNNGFSLLEIEYYLDFVRRNSDLIKKICKKC